MDLKASLEQASALIEQLAKAYAELKNQENTFCENIPWEDIEGHFRNFVSTAEKKVEELEVKEKEVTEKESLIAEKEAEVVAKEQDLLDRVQEVKDAAAEVIIEAKVNCSINDEHVDGAKGQVVAEELTQFCERMDSKGLLGYVTENLNSSSSACRKQFSNVVLSAGEPARLVLDAVEGFFPPPTTNEPTTEQPGVENNSDDAGLRAMRLSCLLLMEAFSAFLAKADDSSTADKYLNADIKQRAKAIADEWKPKLGMDSMDAANGKSLEARAFLRLLLTFRIVSEFNEEDICKYVLATAHHRQAVELCRSLELSHKIPGMVETLIEAGRNIEAVNFILSFELAETFPPIPLLKSYLKDLRRSIQGNGDLETQNEYNARELTAIRAVMRVVKDYKLELDYPLDPLRKRLVQLQNSVNDRKRKRDRGKYRKTDSQGNEIEGGATEYNKQDAQSAFTGITEYSSAVPSAYNHPNPNQTPYIAQANDRTYGSTLPSQPTYVPPANDQTSYYYAQPPNASGASTFDAYSTGAPTVSGYPTGAPTVGGYPSGAPPFSAYSQPQQPYM